MTRNEWLKLLGFAGFLLLCWATVALLSPKDSFDKFLATLKARDVAASSAAPSPSRTAERRMHYGFDLACPSGTRLKVVTDGAVMFSGPCEGHLHFEVWEEGAARQPRLDAPAPRSPLSTAREVK